MVGIVGIIASLTVLGLSLIITRIATTALNLTGLSWEAAKFQARSAFTGTGFTTSESERVVNHPVRRQVVMWLMIVRSAGLISIIISLILSFGSTGEDELPRLIRLACLILGVGILWVTSRSQYIEQWMRRVIERALNRWTELEIRDYPELLKLFGEFTVREVTVDENAWLADKQVKECRLHDEGVLILGIYRADGHYVGAPLADTRMYAGDVLILYGRSSTLKNLDTRVAGAKGESEHMEAVSEQRREESKQQRKESEYGREA